MGGGGGKRRRSLGSEPPRLVRYRDSPLGGGGRRRSLGSSDQLTFLRLRRRLD